MGESITTTVAERTRERDRFVWLFNNCQDRVGLYDCAPDAESKSLWFEDEPTDHPTRDLTADDVKVTVKWSQNAANHELAHLKTIENRQYFTLGIRFERWRTRPLEQRWVTLVHELAHARYAHHGQAYWQFVIDIWAALLDNLNHIADWYDDDEVGGKFRPAIYSEPLDAGYLRNRMLDDIRDNATREVWDAMRDRAEQRLDYQYDWVTALDYPRKYSGDPAVRAPADGWAEDATRVDPARIEFAQQYTDQTLFDLYESLTPVYEQMNIYDIPEIHGVEEADGSVRITEHEVFAALIARTTRYDGTVPVRVE